MLSASIFEVVTNYLVEGFVGFGSMDDIEIGSKRNPSFTFIFFQDM